MKPRNEVRCPYCDAEPGMDCTTAGGNPIRGMRAHASRWVARRFSYRKPRRWTIVADNPDFGLSAGDVVIAEPYWLDPEKVSVLWRERDGYEPDCNQYRNDVKPIIGPDGVVPDDVVRAWRWRDCGVGS